jgi:hypothetical protein
MDRWHKQLYGIFARTLAYLAQLASTVGTKLFFGSRATLRKSISAQVGFPLSWETAEPREQRCHLPMFCKTWTPYDECKVPKRIPCNPVRPEKKLAHSETGELSKLSAIELFPPVSELRHSGRSFHCLIDPLRFAVF